MRHARISSVGWILFLAIGQIPARASVVTDSPDLPVVGGQYYAAPGTDVEYSFPDPLIDLRHAWHGHFENVTRYTVGADEHYEFTASIAGTVWVTSTMWGLDEEPYPFEVVGPLHAVAYGKAGQTTGTFNVEITSMDLTDEIPTLLGPMPVVVRESPTETTSGQTTITDIGGGYWHIDSFFDVYTELSLDGSPFVPSTGGSFRINLGEIPGESELIRIGDVDGLGFENPPPPNDAPKNVHGDRADTNGNGILEPGEWVVDINEDGAVQEGGGDDFDHRSMAEARGRYVELGDRVFDLGSTGSDWTDMSISTSFAGDFPDPEGPELPNCGTFTFDFFVPDDAISPDRELFLRIVGGEVGDGEPSEVVVTRADSSSFTLPLPDSESYLGELIARLAFDDVFTATTDGYHGYLEVFVNSPEDPYLVGDYAELSLVPQQFVIPEPVAVLPLLLIGLGMAWAARRRGGPGG